MRKTSWLFLRAQFKTREKSGTVKSVIISQCFRKSCSLFAGKQHTRKAHTVYRDESSGSFKLGQRAHRDKAKLSRRKNTRNSGTWMKVHVPSLARRHAKLKDSPIPPFFQCLYIRQLTTALHPGSNSTHVPESSM